MVMIQLLVGSTMGSTSAIIFCFALVVVQGKINWEEVKGQVDKCRKETGAEETMESVIKREEIPTTEKGMCLIECLLRVKGIYGEEGNYIKEGAKKYFEGLFSDKPEFIEKVCAIAEECSKIDVQGLNKCEAAAKRVTCGMAKAAEQNIKADKS